MTLHLIESTLVLLFALCVARLPRLAARTRHAIVFAALVKCAIPSSLITLVLNRLAPPGTISIRIFGAAGRAFAAAEPAPRAFWSAILASVWITIAVLLLARALLLARRMWLAALRDTTPPSERELTALARARRHAGVTREVALVRSPFTFAPAALGIVKGTIVLPPGCDALDDQELAAILAHECAHVARRDNLLGLIETVIECAFWFHPLVWLARRTLAHTREEACDDVALAAAPDAYLDALTTIARGATAVRVPSISCMAAANLRERIQHIMHFEPSRLLPHRAIVTAAIAVIAVLSLAMGVSRAEQQPQAGKQPYTAPVLASRTPQRPMGAEPIDIDLENADIRDVMKTFARLTNTTIVVAPDVSASISVHLKQVPWDEALEKIVRDAHLHLKVEEKIIHITR